MMDISFKKSSWMIVNFMDIFHTGPPLTVRYPVYLTFVTRHEIDHPCGGVNMNWKATGPLKVKQWAVPSPKLQEGAKGPEIPLEDFCWS